MKAILFINGVPPVNIPDLSEYDFIACTDGAFHYLKDKQFPLKQLDFISGDFDSHSGKDELVYDDKFIYTPDQNKTDFQKALEILIDKGVSVVDVYGGSGGEMDHFLGNLTVAYTFKDTLEIIFFDETSKYYFTSKKFVLDNVDQKMISLYPFPEVKKIVSKGLEWELVGGNLGIKDRISTRNRANNSQVEISYESGDLVVFVHH